jgi:hypothetical protein
MLGNGEFTTLLEAASVEPVTILQQPQSVEVPSGAIVRLSIEATGSIDGYTWVDDTGHVVGESGPSANILELLRVDSNRPTGYHVPITNANNIVTSAVATVTVRLTKPEFVWKGRLFKKWPMSARRSQDSPVTASPT